MATERNPKHGKFEKPEGYNDLGWQLHSGNSEEVKRHIDEKHQSREYDNSLYMYRCTDVITICDQCKAIWHTDMSD